MENRTFVSAQEVDAVQQCPGVMRQVLSYSEEVMMCRFTLEKGADIPLHAHAAVQNGYVLSGKLEFLRADGSSYLAAPGDSYVFLSNEPHGVRCLEETVVVENFLPARKEFL